MTITNGAGTNTITVSASSTFSQGNVLVSGSNATCTSVSSNATGKSVSRDVPATPSAITGPGTICPNTGGHIFSVTAVTGLTYFWTMPAGLTIVSGQGTSSITVDAGPSWIQGTIYAQAYNSTCNVPSNPSGKTVNKNGCRTFEENPASVLEVFTAFPVPAHEEVIIRFETQDEVEYQLDLYDIKGKLVKSRTDMSTPGKNLMVMDVRTLHSGIYMMRITGANGHKGSARVVVE